VRENTNVILQIASNTPEQAMPGDFPKAVEDAILDSKEAYQEQWKQLMGNLKRAAGFARVVFDLLVEMREKVYMILFTFFTDQRTRLRGHLFLGDVPTFFRTQDNAASCIISKTSGASYPLEECRR
jgi:hypothetical protein